jgi:hypothetical protein
MEYKITTRVPASKVWEAWETAHAVHGQPGITQGQKGLSNNPNAKGFKYKLLDVIPGEKFSILWKTFFVRLIFTHSVKSTTWGTEICYSVLIKGLFAWPVRRMLGNKIQQNLSLVLKAMVKQLEQQN